MQPVCIFIGIQPEIIVEVVIAVNAVGFAGRNVQLRRRDVRLGASFVIQSKIAETGVNEFHQRIPQQFRVAKQDRLIDFRQNSSEIGEKKSGVDFP